VAQAMLIKFGSLVSSKSGAVRLVRGKIVLLTMLKPSSGCILFQIPKINNLRSGFPIYVQNRSF
jgi:hypothetical protein